MLYLETDAAWVISLHVSTTPSIADGMERIAPAVSVRTLSGWQDRTCDLKDSDVRRYEMMRRKYTIPLFCHLLALYTARDSSHHLLIYLEHGSVGLLQR